MACLFVSHRNGEARHHELTCNENFSRFIAEDVVSWAEKNARIHPLDNLICGLSLSGLASAYTAFRYPLVFSRALSQSGSFWWLVDHQASFPPATPRLWLSVGKEETTAGVTHPPSGLFQGVSQIEGVRNAVSKFEALGATVKYNPYEGGHAMAAWRNELAAALQWLVQP
jgi:enterochelin esterase family protein